MHGYDDYAEPSSHRGSPLLVLALVAILMLLSCLPFLPLWPLVADVLFGVSD